MEDANTPNGLLPYTVRFPDEEGGHSADLEHGAPLPRVGESVELIDDARHLHRYRVRDVIHTLQPALPSNDDDNADDPGSSGELRAGLPVVLLERLADDPG